MSAFKKLKQNTDSEVHVRPNNHDNQSKNVQQSHHFTREAIKQRMEKDVDEVGKIARFIKAKIEELDKENLVNRQKRLCALPTFWVMQEAQERAELLGRAVSAVKSGRIQVNGKTVSISYRVKSSDKITHFLHRHEPPVMALDVTILHKGEDVLTVCKPASVPVHPCGQYRKNTVVGILEAEHNIAPLFPIHQLDRLVSGLLILARSAAQADIFRQQIENGTVQKQYIAKVVGEFPEEEATQHGVIGIDLYGAWYEPYADVPEDVLVAQRSRTFNVGWCADPLVFGDYPDMMKKRAGSRLPTFTEVEKRTVKGSFDFLGVNHYNAESVKHIPNVKLQIRRDDKAQIEQAHRRVPITRPDLVQRTIIP